MRPGPALDRITGLYHGGQQPRDIGQGRIEQDKIGRHWSVFLALLLSWFFNAQIDVTRMSDMKKIKTKLVIFITDNVRLADKNLVGRIG